TKTVEFVRGVINLRGVVTPIIDLRVRFGMQPSEDSESTRLIIVYIDEVEVGLVVDSANDVIDIQANAIEPAPEVVGTVDVDYIDGVAKLANRLLILLHLENIVKRDDMKALKIVEG